MNQPLITIGITSYNAESTIARAIQSALAQDWENKEIIVYDDASTDGTREILKNFPDITILEGVQNGGVARARNALIDNARGAFLAFFDDDDESAPQRLRLQYERLERYDREIGHGAPVICHAARLQVYPDGAQRYEPAPGCDETVPAPRGEAMARRILYGAPLRGGFGSMATCAQMAPLEVYKALGGFDPAFARAEDTDFNIRLALSNGHFLGIDTALVRQTMTYGDEKTLAAEEESVLMLLAKYRDFIDENADYHFCRRWIQTKYDYLRGDKKSFFRKLGVLTLSRPVPTLQRLLWALPNRAHHRAQRAFHQDAPA